MKSSTQAFASLITVLAAFSQSAIANSSIRTLSQHSINVNSYHALTSKGSECTNMISIVNQTVANTKATTSFGTKGDIQTLQELVRIFARAAKDLKSVNVSDEKLKAYKGQYLSMYQGASEINKQLIISVKKRNSTKTSENLRKSKNIFRPERDLAAGLTQYCKQP
jgi:hypothetical protein